MFHISCVNNFFNFNGNPYYTPTFFSDFTNVAYHNFNQPSVTDWSYPNQYNLCPQSYDIISKIISTLHRVNGDSPSRVRFSTNLSSLSTLSTIFPRFMLSSTSSKQKASILKMSMHGSKQQSQNLTGS